MRLWLFVLIACAAVGFFASRTGPSAEPASPVRMGAPVSTSRESLDSSIAVMRARVQRDPGDGEAAVILADALMRAARVEGAASLAVEAERAVRAALACRPEDYGSRRMLGAVLLAQHRFADALEAARTAQQHRPDDAWNYAVAGDALLELGRYEEAFEAFDELNRRKPDPGAYARAAYARELQGDLPAAVRLMQMAADGTGANDPEALAWYLSQLGHLRLLEGRPDEAAREFARADHAFPDHPYARAGRARVLVAQGRFREAYVLLARGLDTPETWAMRGDIARRLGDAGAARAAYREAERLEREGWKDEEPQPGALARFFAERALNVPEAVALAREAARVRRDIHTLDALAWAHFQAGNLDQAAEAIAGALRTGTADPRIRCHADAIATARRTALEPSGTVCEPITLYSRAASGRRLAD